MAQLRVFIEGDAFAPGQTVRGRVDLDWPRPRPVRGVRVSLVGLEETRIRVKRGKSSRTHTETNPIIAEELLLFGGCGVGALRAFADTVKGVFGSLDYPVLKAGRHRYPFDFRLPSVALPTFEGAYATVKYRLEAHVDIPAAIDRKYEGEIFVLPPDELAIAPYKGKGRLAPGGLLKAFRADLGMDLRFGGCRLSRGERLEGRLLLQNHSGKKIRGATISLVAVEHAEAGGHKRENTLELASGYLRAPDPAAAAQDVQFGIKLPPCPVPYAGRHSRLELFLVAEVDVALGLDTRLQIPLEIS